MNQLIVFLTHIWLKNKAKVPQNGGIFFVCSKRFEQNVSICDLRRTSGNLKHLRPDKNRWPIQSPSKEGENKRKNDVLGEYI